ncbi:MAG: hypothetical protein JXO72_13650 [Vicinamibacteria bacterium]|nr:hypothetical protein [Vicinamibacteria bacterium]
MRSLGAFLILVGISGYIYCASQLSNASLVPPGSSIMETLRYPAGQMELGRYVAVILGAIGALLTVLPRER